MSMTLEALCQPNAPRYLCNGIKGDRVFVHLAVHLPLTRSSMRARSIEVNERREMLMRRKTPQVAGGFTFLGVAQLRVAQLTSPVHGGRRPSARV